MEINNFGKINKFNSSKEQKKSKQQDKNETKEIEANASQALASFGQAQVMGIRASKQDEAFEERYERIQNAIMEEMDYPTYAYEYMARKLAEYEDTEDKPLHSRIIELIRRNVDLNNIESLATSPDTEEKPYYSRIISILDKGINERYLNTLVELPQDKFDEAMKLIDMGITADNVHDLVYLQDTEDIPFAKRRDELINLGLKSSYSIYYLTFLQDSESTPDYSTAIDKIKNMKDKESFATSIARFIHYMTKNKSTFTERYKKSLNLMLYKNVKSYSCASEIGWLKDTEEQPYYSTALQLLDDGIDEKYVATLSKIPNPTENPQRDNAVHLLSREKLSMDKILRISSYNNDDFHKLMNLLENGYDCIENTDFAIKNYDTLMKRYSKPSELKDFLNSSEWHNIASSINQVNYREEMNEIINPVSIPLLSKISLLNSNVSPDEIRKGLPLLFKTKSPFNQAMKNPKTYISDPFNAIEENYAKKHLIKFFKNNLGSLIRIINYLDNDTINQLMSQHTDLFKEELSQLNILTTENYKLLSKLITCKRSSDNKALSAKEKIELSHIVLTNQLAQLDMTSLKDSQNKGVIDLKKEKEKLKIAFLIKAGITEEEISEIPPEKLNFNEKYSHQLLGTNAKYMNTEVMNEIIGIINETRCHALKDKEEILESIKNQRGTKYNKEFENAATTIEDFFETPDKYTDDEIIQAFSVILKDMANMKAETDIVIQAAVRGNFKDFISDNTNIYGQTNAETEEIFKRNKLNFEKWQSPDIQDVKISAASKDMTIKLWDRNPQEDLFMGNKTSCCTATNGVNGAATPSYLLNKAFNVIELYDDKSGEMYGMSRVFMANINDEPSLMMDNIELNNTYFKNMDDEQKTKVRNAFFEYAQKYAKEVTGKENPPVYFSTSYVNVNTGDLNEISAATDFIGKISEASIYINAANKEHWFNPSDMKDQGEINWYKIN